MTDFFLLTKFEQNSNKEEIINEYYINIKKFIVLKEKYYKRRRKNIVVTGGDNSMGRELLLQLLAKGVTIFAVDIKIWMH
ncbi:hypothetical protein [Sporosalibacterium faouarense]|uniref:hypothetical protein n=1 Tax=Sporosalibacterium faouarense TaxID=516123 RepID=UPI00192BE2D2|nr:hypothetical protein [Sporosalibacterium faouarense]